MIQLLITANKLYTKFSTMLQYLDVDPLVLLKPFILQESFKSCELTGNTTPQASLYFIKYQQPTKQIEDIMNYYHILLNIEQYLSNRFNLSVSYLHAIHKDLFKYSDIKMPKIGKYRDKETWIGARGRSMYEAEYIPPHPLDVPVLMGNYIKHFNKNYSLDKMIDIAVSHAQFENIHPYKDGNGRLGRILIPIQAYLQTTSLVSLFMSDMIKENQYMYFSKLKDTRNGKWESYINFFLKMMTEQLEKHVKILDDVIEIYKKDQPVYFELIKQKNSEKVFHYMFSNIVTTIKEASETLKIDYQTMRNYCNKLHNKGILSKQKISNGEYVYIYTKLYTKHVPVDWL